jgi:hypothetical protein
MQPIDRDALESRWQANESQLKRLYAAESPTSANIFSLR